MILPIKKMVLELDVKFFSVVKELEDELLGCSLIYLCLLHGVSTEEEIEKITGYSPEKIRKAIDFLGKKDYIKDISNFKVLENRLRMLEKKDIFIPPSNNLEEKFDSAMEKDTLNADDLVTIFSKFFEDEYSFTYKDVVTLKEKKMLKDLQKEYSKDKAIEIIKYGISNWDLLFSRVPLTISNLYGRRETIFFKVPKRAIRKEENKGVMEW
jgi:hypothetical protein